jgi:hypothetical protein
MSCHDVLLVTQNVLEMLNINEPRLDKTNIIGLRPAWSGSMLVANPLRWFCHVAAQIVTCMVLVLLNFFVFFCLHFSVFGLHLLSIILYILYKTTVGVVDI